MVPTIVKHISVNILVSIIALISSSTFKPSRIRYYCMAEENRKKPCRACNSYTDQKKDFLQTVNRFTKPKIVHKQCPPDREELGRNTWGYLHTMAAYWQDAPSTKEKSAMRTFIRQFSKTYPCEDCAYALRVWMKSNPPDVASQSTLSRWFCEAHNDVNERLGKKLFDCSLVEQRWRDGWDDGSCD